MIDKNYYYVYEHWLYGEIIYVGKGRKERAFNKDRNNLWMDIVKDNFKEVKIVIKGYFKNEQDAFLYEKMLIQFYSENGVNLTNIVHNPNAILNLEISFDSFSKNNSDSFSKNKLNNSVGFNHYKQILSNNSKLITLSNYDKTVVFSYSNNKELIKDLYQDDRFTPLVLSPFDKNLSDTPKDKKSNIWQELNKGNIPDPYNVLVIKIEHLDSYNFMIKDSKLELVIANTTSNSDKDKALSKIENNFDMLAYKVNDRDVNIENVELTIPGFFLNLPLTDFYKNKLLNNLNVIDNNGKQIVWKTLEKMLNRSFFYKIEDSKIMIDNKLTQVSTISLN